MNLLLDSWLTARLQDGSRRVISLQEIVLPEVVDIEAPRLDFRGALYQLLIGLLQTAFSPEKRPDWEKYWQTPPGMAELQGALQPWVGAFELDADGVAFMQDFDLPQAETKAISALLIEAPGDKTVRDNLDHFIKRDSVQGMCPACAATALFALQINAPSGGVGHRVSLRGGGPLTTLLLPADPAAPLWQKLWLNVLPLDKFTGLQPGSGSRSAILPWLAPTRVSDAKGSDTTPEVAHPLQAYWSMPRRIRLDFADVTAGTCDVCGANSERLVSQYRAKNYGTNYTGSWIHPLTPYNRDPKNEKPPLSIKGQKGGIGYRHWASLALPTEEESGAQVADVVRVFHNQREKLFKRQHPPLLWCFGFDMDNMKARCWYDTLLPIYSLEPSRQKIFENSTHKMLAVAQEAASLLGKYVKAAFFTRPGDAGNEPAVPQSFWQKTEAGFYMQLRRMAELETLDDFTLAPVWRDWLSLVRRSGTQLFDEWVLAAPIEDQDMKRVVLAREELAKWLVVAKPMKELRTLIKGVEEAKALS